MIGTESERLQYLDSLYPSWPDDTLWTFFQSRVKSQPQAPCLYYQEESYTYLRMDEFVRRLSRSLYARGVRPGDHVAVSLHNSPLSWSMIFALARLGAVRVPLNMQMNDTEKAFIIGQSHARWVVGTGLDSFSASSFPNIAGFLPVESENRFLQAGDGIPDFVIDEVERRSRNPLAVCDIMYTSGSTSFPKGVRLTHDMLLRTSYATCRTRRMEEGRRILVPLPFYHIFACSEGILASMHVGGSIIIADRKYSPDNILYLMKRHAAKDIICVPLVAIEILELCRASRSEGTAPFPALHAAFISPAGPDWLWQEFKDVFRIADVTTGYGMTECSATSVISSPLDDSDLLKRAAGKLKDAGAAGLTRSYPHLLHIKICDMETGRECPVGVIGEILCRGLTVTPGYYDNPQENGKVFDPDGWFHTGDLGHFDTQGNLSFDGRKKDMYKTNGENVSPQKLEMLISRCPGVIQADVIGIPHDKAGEIGAAFIDAGAMNTDSRERQRIQDWCRSHMASYELPRFFFFESQNEWPRSASNKVQKDKMRERAKTMIARMSC